MSAEVVATLDLPGNRTFVVELSDLLKAPVDAIVNAANGRLAHGGGVAAAIARAAGTALIEEGDRLVQQHGTIPVGEAVVTTAGRLPHRAVIHTVGPAQGFGNEGEFVKRALKSAFRRAHERGFTSIAFPAVSSGIFGVPIPVCAAAYVAAVREFLAEEPATSLQRVILCLFPGPMVDEMKRALA